MSGNEEKDGADMHAQGTRQAAAQRCMRGRANSGAHFRVGRDA